MSNPEEVWVDVDRFPEYETNGRGAAEDLGISRGALGDHLKGKFPDVNGLHFEKLAEI